MTIPGIMQKTIKDLSILSDNVEPIAIINMLNAKLTNMVSLAGIKFKQYSNASNRTLSYYGMNFMGSGEKKDFTVNNINDYLLSFLKDEMKKSIEDYKEELYYELDSIHNKKQKEKKEKEIDKIRVENFELSNPNYTGLYAEARQYDTIGFGCIFIRIGELGDYLDNVTSGNQSKKELWQKMKDIYEGTISPSIIAGDGNRPTVEKMPVQILLYTDYDKLRDDRVKQYYISSLKTGMARRSFIYMNKKINNKLSYPLNQNIKNEIILKLKEVEKEYKKIFQQLKSNPNKILLFSEEADELIYKYQCECIDYFNNNPQINIICRNEVKESYWKITKLACVYSAISEPTNNLVKACYVQMAIDFYNEIKDGLLTTIETHEPSVVEKFAEWFYYNRQQTFSRMAIRKANIIKNNASFTKTFEALLPDIKEEMQSNYNCYLVPYEDNVTTNSKGLQVIEIKKKGEALC